MVYSQSPSSYTRTCLLQEGMPQEERARRIGLLIVAIWIMNAFDLSLTLMAHQQGLLVEVNPIAHAILPYGPMALSFFKILMVVIGTCILLSQRRLQFAEYMTWLVVAVYVLVSLQWMICYECYDTAFVENTHDLVIAPVTGVG